MNADFGQAEIDDEQLHQRRGATKQLDVIERGAPQCAVAGKPCQRHQQTDDQADDQRTERQLECGPGGRQQFDMGRVPQLAIAHLNSP
ncbi:hypothetical protein D3C73_1358830 [compost metagenome]